ALVYLSYRQNVSTVELSEYKSIRKILCRTDIDCFVFRMLNIQIMTAPKPIILPLPVDKIASSFSMKCRIEQLPNYQIQKKEQLKNNEFANQLTDNKLKWFQHISHMETSRLSKQTLQYIPRGLQPNLEVERRRKKERRRGREDHREITPVYGDILSSDVVRHRG
ncbi:hypothetical protein L9F63_005759, partial [Diploptera punctata]